MITIPFVLFVALCVLAAAVVLLAILIICVVVSVYIKDAVNHRHGSIGRGGKRDEE